jgi:hypothetical protein
VAPATERALGRKNEHRTRVKHEFTRAQIMGGRMKQTPYNRAWPDPIPQTQQSISTPDRLRREISAAWDERLSFLFWGGGITIARDSACMYPPLRFQRTKGALLLNRPPRRDLSRMLM